MGEPAAAALSTTRLDGRSLNLDELRNAVSAMPFLTPRRLVILANPLAYFNREQLRVEFTRLLDAIPGTTALVLTEQRTLKENHWLMRWARRAGARAFVRSFSLQRGPAMVQWIQTQAKNAGGQFTFGAAEMLANLVGDDARMAHQEIVKLLTYVNYKRPVEPEDVAYLTPGGGVLNDYALVNALRSGDGRAAMAALRSFLQKDDPLRILHGIVYQFRLLLLARDILDQGGQIQDVIKQLGAHLRINAYPARLAAENARQYDAATLEEVYRYLLRMDEAIKTGQVPGDVALDTFVAAFTSQGV